MDEHWKHDAEGVSSQAHKVPFVGFVCNVRSLQLQSGGLVARGAGEEGVRVHGQRVSFG